MAKTISIPVMAVNPKENKASIMARVEKFFSPSERIKFEIAYIFSKYGHRGQVRKYENIDGVPLRYFEHPRSGFLVIFDELGIRDHDLICAFMMHDCPEDSKDVTFEIIESVFHRDVAKIVFLLTNRDLKTGHKLEMEEYVKRLVISGNWLAMIAKMVDTLINLRGVNDEDSTDEDFGKHFVLKVGAYVPISIKLNDSPIYKDEIQKLRSMIREEIEKAGEKFDLHALPTF